MRRDFEWLDLSAQQAKHGGDAIAIDRLAEHRAQLTQRPAHATPRAAADPE